MPSGGQEQILALEPMVLPWGDFLMETVWIVYSRMIFFLLFTQGGEADS